MQSAYEAAAVRVGLPWLGTDREIATMADVIISGLIYTKGNDRAGNRGWVNGSGRVRVSAGLTDPDNGGKMFSVIPFGASLVIKYS